MQWFKNLKTATKLGLGFGLCLLLAGVIGIGALMQMSRMNKTSEAVITDSLAGISSLAQFSSDFKQIRNLEFRFVLGIQEPEDRAKLAAAQADANKALKEYSDGPTVTIDTQNLNTLKAHWQLLETHLAQMMDGSATKSAADKQASMKQSFSNYNKLVDQTNVMMQWNHEQAVGYQHEIVASYRNARTLTIGLLALAIIVGALVGLSISRYIVGTLAQVSTSMDTLRTICVANLDTALQAAAIGDLSVSVKTGTPPLELNSKDEFGALASTFNSLLNQVKSSIRSFDTLLTGQKEKVEIAKQIAAGDLDCHVTPKSDKDTLGLALAQMVESLSTLVSQATQAANTIAQSSAEVSAGNEDLSQRTEEQASSLEETAASMEEMTATVKQNADNAKQANQFASQARTVAEKGGSVVENAVTAMGEISSASKRIADIISVIDEIAFQTNLLALNAAVEAARVGEQGRGFAVVAAEVRSLAGRSATAAKEIKSLVQDSVQKVDEGSALVNQSGERLTEIVASVKKVAEIIAEISAAGQEQATGIEQVNKAIMQMDQITQQNASLVEEASATSQMMNQQAKSLQTVVAQFKISGKYQVQTQPQSMALQATGTHGHSSAARTTTRKSAASLTLVHEDDKDFEEF